VRRGATSRWSNEADFRFSSARGRHATVPGRRRLIGVAGPACNNVAPHPAGRYQAMMGAMEIALRASGAE
jgi:hypothetical protein